MSSLGDAAKTKVTAYADVAYTEAIGALHVNPEIVAALSPMAKSLYDLGVSVIEKQAGDILSDVGGKVMSAVGDAVGEGVKEAVSGVVSTVAGAVGDIVPVVNAVLAFYSIVSIPSKARAAEVGRRLQKFVDQGTLSGSDYNLGVNAADIFAPIANDGDLAYTGFYWNRPRSMIGACFAAITEDNTADLIHAGVLGPDGDSHGVSQLDIASSTDSNLHHSAWYWDVTQPPSLASIQAGEVPYFVPDVLGLRGGHGPTNLNAGKIPATRRAVYRALRTAMGARGHDQGAALFPAYFDMLLEDWHSGAIDAEFMAATIYQTVSKGGGLILPAESIKGSGAVDRPGVIPIPLEMVQSLIDPMIAMIHAWDANRAKIQRHPFLHLAPFSVGTTPAVVSALLKKPFGAALVQSVSTFSPTLQAVILQSAYRTFVTRPVRPRPLAFNPALLAGLLK